MTTLFAARRADRHQDGLGGRPRAVVKAGVRHVHPRQPRDHRLVFEQRRERSLARLGLVGRVRRVELAPRGDEVDDRGDEMIVASAAQETGGGGCRGVPLRQLADVVPQREFPKRGGQIERPIEPELARDHVEQFVDRLGADRFEHRPAVIFRVGNIRHVRSLSTVLSEFDARSRRTPFHCGFRQDPRSNFQLPRTGMPRGCDRQRRTSGFGPCPASPATENGPPAPLPTRRPSPPGTASDTPRGPTIQRGPPRRRCGSSPASPGRRGLPTALRAGRSGRC